MKTQSWETFKRGECTSVRWNT